MSGFKKAAKLAAWVVLIFLTWGNLVFWARIISPKGSLILVAITVGFSFLIAKWLTSGKFRRTFWNLKERLATIGVAYIIDAIINWLINYPLYVVIINWKGKYVGGAIMLFVSLIVCLIYLAIYDLSKSDFFGLEKAKESIGKWKTDRSWKLRLIANVNEKSKWLTFVLLAFWKDSFYATMFWRKPEEKFKGLSSETWKILFLAILIENVPWIFTVAGVIWIWKLDLDAEWFCFEDSFLYILELIF